MKKQFQTPEITVIFVNAEDAITTSGFVANGVYGEGSGGWTDFSKE